MPTTLKECLEKFDERRREFCFQHMPWAVRIIQQVYSSAYKAGQEDERKKTAIEIKQRFLKSLSRHATWPIEDIETDMEDELQHFLDESLTAERPIK
jgi:hypothetical protein